MLLAIASDMETIEYPLPTIKPIIKSNGITGFWRTESKFTFSTPSIITNRAETAPINTSIVENNGENRTEFQNIHDGCVFGGMVPSKNAKPETS